MDIEGILSITSAVLLSLGGAGVIILGLSNWLGRVWPDRLMQAQRSQHENALERLRAELRQKAESELETLRSLLQEQMDVLLRRRQVYERIAVAMRVFLSASNSAMEEQKREFLEAHDLSMLWAPDSVVDAIGAFLDLRARHAAQPGSVRQQAMKEAYTRCLTEMRRDAGFPGTSRESYRVVSF